MLILVEFVKQNCKKHVHLWW